MTHPTITENMRKAHAIVEGEHANGYPNRETYLWLLHMENSEVDQAYLVEIVSAYGNCMASADIFKNDMEKQLIDANANGFTRNMVQCVIDRIDWRYVVNHVSEAYADQISMEAGE